jgi:hypothetical protein
MKTVFDQRLHADLLARLDRISDDMQPRWGRMTAPQMLDHLVESMKLVTGELQAPPENLPIRHAPLRQLIVYWLPWPKGSPTAQVLMPRADCPPMQRSKTEVARLLRDIAGRVSQKEWPEHPAFGPIGRRGWGVLTLRHILHHLKQFGA